MTERNSEILQALEAIAEASDPRIKNNLETSLSYQLTIRESIEFVASMSEIEPERSRFYIDAISAIYESTRIPLDISVAEVPNEICLEFL